MRVLKPLILARRRQASAGVVRRDPLQAEDMALLLDSSDAFDLREEPRPFSDTAPLPRIVATP